MNCEKGFTLIESLLALSITGLLLFIAIPISSKFFDKLQEKLFFETLNQHLLVAQNEAITTNQPISLLIREADYNVKSVHHQLPFEQTLPDSYKFIGFPRRNEITFNYKGSISSAGKFSIKAKDKYYWFILPPGKGRARFEEK
ncbi:competence type IV pilus minor pilin ComGD [Aciduricibacillus chroicocephali]|uniref:Competence type IV pilus minor pilin ComGD n=1 Tax=Aciduricibacillus chroicocephali TaxID=3054939 RepID=A0ABY9KV82_9BACI|nr:competence type IV pilus minor pilin ComGD [Bacillaceae bacterium 44XB]